MKWKIAPASRLELLCWGETPALAHADLQGGGLRSPWTAGGGCPYMSILVTGRGVIVVIMLAALHAVTAAVA
jgi:hypothetical protein